MTLASLSIQMDQKLFDELEEFCDEVGMNVPAVFVAFAKNVVRDRQLPFETDPFHSHANQERLRRSIAQMEATGGTVRDLQEYLCDD